MWSIERRALGIRLLVEICVSVVFIEYFPAMFFLCCLLGVSYPRRGLQVKTVRWGIGGVGSGRMFVIFNNICELYINSNGLRSIRRGHEVITWCYNK